MTQTPLTNAERQARYRDRQKAKIASSVDGVQLDEALQSLVKAENDRRCKVAIAAGKRRFMIIDLADVLEDVAAGTNKTGIRAEAALELIRLTNVVGCFDVFKLAMDQRAANKALRAQSRAEQAQSRAEQIAAETAARQKSPEYIEEQRRRNPNYGRF